MDRKDIEKKAKEDVIRILDSFKEQLKDFKEDEDVFISRKETTRVPKRERNPEFKERMLQNAKKHDGDSIIAEKKHW
jgi:hypothetical protein